MTFKAFLVGWFVVCVVFNAVALWWMLRREI